METEACGDGESQGPKSEKEISRSGDDHELATGKHGGTPPTKEEETVNGAEACEAGGETRS